MKNISNYFFFLNKYENTQMCPVDKKCSIPPHERVCVENKLKYDEKKNEKCYNGTFTPILNPFT
jgi:hypothetical protein